MMKQRTKMSSTPTSSPNRRRLAQGASLIEVLVAVLLLSIGILSMVGLQTSALRLTKESQFQGSAAELASSFSETVRANVAGAMAGNYSFVQPYAPPAGPIALPAQQCNNPAAACTPAQIAAVDLARWRESARQALPGGSLFANVTTPLGTAQSPVIDLWVLWQGPETDDAADAATAQLNGNCPAQMGNANPRPQCMQFRIQL